MNSPHPIDVTTYAIRQILEAMIKTDTGSTCSAEQHLATAVMTLNQIADIHTFSDPELQSQLEWCQKIFLRKYSK